MKSVSAIAFGMALGLACQVLDSSSLRADTTIATRHGAASRSGDAASQSAANKLATGERAAPSATSASATSASATSASATPASATPASATPVSATPASAPAPAALADVDPNNDGVVGPPELIADCESRLNAAGIKFKAAKLPLRQRKGGPVCGAEQAVVYQGSPHGIRYGSAPLLTCGMALAVAAFEAIVTEEAAKHLGKRVVSVSHAGTYSCRQMARFQTLVSEHSYANAIDIRSFKLENGRTISVLRDFSKVDTAASKFLHAVAQRLYDENVFSVVLTEYFDRLHRDHFHVDLARYRVDGTR